MVNLGPQGTQNLIPNEPRMADLLTYWQKQIGLQFNCHHIGTVQSFNSLTQTATATINYKKTFLEFSDTADYSYKNDDYPLLIDCPVIVLGGGNGLLTFPITSGDECLIMFNDRDIDNWFSGSSTSGNATGRLHSFSDAVILVGLRSTPHFIVNYNGTDTELRTKDGTTKVTLAAAKVTIAVGAAMTMEIDSTGAIKVTNASGTELFQTIANLFNDIQTGLVTTMLGPEPLVMPSFAAHYTTLGTYL